MQMVFHFVALESFSCKACCNNMASFAICSTSWGSSLQVASHLIIDGYNSKLLILRHQGIGCSSNA
jgi:hypothetical protein